MVCSKEDNANVLIIDYQNAGGIMLSRLPFLIPFIAITEIFLIIRVGGAIGFWPTVSIVMVTGMTGVILLRQQSFQLIMQLNQKLNQGQLPATEMIEGVCLMMGGVMLITPGFLTDICGFCLLLPWTRKRLALKMSSVFTKQVQSGAASGFYYSSGGSPFAKGQGAGYGFGEAARSDVDRGSERTIEGEFSEVDEKEENRVEKK